jgi:hypothetical protein
MKCRICGAISEELHRATLLMKYEVQYYRCPRCGFVQTETPFWLEEAYSSPLSASDTGVMSRNLSYADLASIILRLFCSPSDRFLDFGGGYGIFVRLMRDRGFDFYWFDKYAQNLMARGFEGSSSDTRYAAVTSFENFEHFENPVEELERITTISDLVLFSTTLISDKPPLPQEWWYYCLEHGQHISLYTHKALLHLAQLFNLKLTSDGVGLHILSKRDIHPKLFLVLKIARRLRLGRLFWLPSKTFDDMHFIIEKGEQP